MKQTSVNSKSEMQFLIVAGVLVLLLGGATINSLMKEPSVPTVVAQNSNSNSDSSANTIAGNRMPASAQNIPVSANTQQDVVSASMQVSCDEEVNEEIMAGHLRLTGSSCKGVEDVKIVNQTNGFSASVIFTKNKKFTTDFIDLSEGKNVLQIKSVAKDGSEKIQSLYITRRRPASH